MDDEKIDYKYWAIIAKVDGWSLADARYVLGNYTREVLTVNGIFNKG